MKTLVKNGLVITFIHEGYHSIKMKYADVLIEDGAFLDIREEIADSEAEVVDAQGLWVLPGLVDVGSSVAGAVLGNGLLPDYSRARWQGSMLHGRALPLLEIAAEALSDAEKRAVVRFGLEQLLLSGATTVADLTHPAFAPALRAEGEALGLRLLAFPESTAAGCSCPSAQAAGLPRATRSTRWRRPPRRCTPRRAHPRGRCSCARPTANPKSRSAAWPSASPPWASSTARSS